MIKINGSVFNSRCVSVINGKVIVEGTIIEPDKNLVIAIEGNIDSLSVDVCNSITVNGSCNRVKTTSGDVRCGDVGGDVTTMSGDIDAKTILGDCETMSGDVRHGK